MDLPAVEHLFLITGTTRGIGKALAAEARKVPGSFVVCLSRAKPSLWRNQQNIQIDLNNIEAIAPALEAVHFDFRAADSLQHTVLINNAGVLAPIAPIGDCDDPLLARNIQVNLTAPLVLAHRFYGFSRPFRGRKWIVNITSGASQVPYYGWSAYGAAKAGLDMATRAMALEFSRIDPAFGACAVAPGTVDTDMQAQIRRCTAEQFERVAKFLDLKTSGGLYPPRQTAAALIRYILEERFQNGGRYDLREMGV